MDKLYVLECGINSSDSRYGAVEDFKNGNRFKVKWKEENHDLISSYPFVRIKNIMF
jgi:hypothetical protein